MLTQMPQRGTNGTPRRVDSGKQEEEKPSHDLLIIHGLPVDFSVNEVRDDVIERVLTARFHILTEVIENFFGCSLGDIHVIGPNFE